MLTRMVYWQGQDLDPSKSHFGKYSVKHHVRANRINVYLFFFFFTIKALEMPETLIGSKFSSVIEQNYGGKLVLVCKAAEDESDRF